MIHAPFDVRLNGCKSSNEKSFAIKRTGAPFSNSAGVKVEHCLASYMQKTCDVAGEAILAKINLRKKCVNRDKM